MQNSIIMYFTECNKMKTKYIHTVGTVPTSYRKMVERGKIDTPKTHIYIYT